VPLDVEARESFEHFAAQLRPRRVGREQLGVSAQAEKFAELGRPLFRQLVQRFVHDFVPPAVTASTL
jgi:hypothetical protein